MEIEKINLINKYRDDYNPGHDDTQIEHFIVWNNHTDYGRYKQAIAEVSSHYEALQTSYILQKKNNAEVLIIEAEIEELESMPSKVSKAKIWLKLVEIEEKKLTNNSIERQIARNLNELNKTLILAQKYEKLIEWKDRKVLEKEYHVERLQKLLALNISFWWSNLSWVMDVITALPDDMQNPLMNLSGELHQINNQMRLWRT